MKFKLDHISYAVKSSDDAINGFEPLYPNVEVYKCLEINHNVYISYLTSENLQHKIELVEPYGEPNPVKNILKSQDSVLYHICYRVDNFNEAINYMEKKKYFMIANPFETTVEKNIWACHFFNPNIGIVEIMGKIRNE